eukprot:scaffold616_cov306-Pavlova_lutheri.AAC.32
MGGMQTTLHSRRKKCIEPCAAAWTWKRNTGDDSSRNQGHRWRTCYSKGCRRKTIGYRQTS